MDRDQKNYVETLPEDQVADVAPAAPPPPAAAPTPEGKGFRLGFYHRVALHLILVILFAGLIVTAGLAWRVRKVMYEEEFRSAYTVYTAAANYVAAHLRSHKGKVVPDRLDYVFRERFMRAEQKGHVQSDVISHHPSRIVLYGVDGQVQYVFDEAGANATPPPLPPERLPRDITRWIDREANVIHVSGAIAPEEEVAGYMDVTFPASIRDKLFHLFMEMGLLTVAVLLCATGMSLVFARRELAPIMALTAAAHEVRQGNLAHRAPIRSGDEIGELASTFNGMVDTLSLRIALMGRLKDALVRIGRYLEGDQLYQTLVSAFSELSSAAACRLYLRAPGKDGIVRQAGAAEEHLPPPDDDELAQLAFETRWAHCLRPDGESAGESEPAAEVAIPLLSGTHRNGVIRLGPPTDGLTHSPEAIAVMHTLAQFASVAIENAGLYAALGEKERIEQEMRWARNIQQSMLPRQRPYLPGYEVFGQSMPATEVGGDYFDYVHGRNGEWHIVIGDVSGKGVPAALIMSIVRSLIHTYLEFESSPRNVLKLVNRSLSADLDPDMFVTLSELWLDPETNRVRLARAGHEPLLILRDTGQVERVEPRGAALGLLDVERFQETIEEQEFTLHRGETLMLYTDGVTEAQNSGKEEFGLERLVELLKRHGHRPPREIYDTIIHEVSSYAMGMPQRDDITLVVLCRDPG